jgi:hypothetical protein
MARSRQVTNDTSPEQKLKADFRIFLSVLWNSIGLPKPTRAQVAMADYLQHGPKRLQLSCFRGLGKSYVTAGFVLWELFRDKDKKILIISASKDRADANALFLQKLILEVPWLQHMAPVDDNQRWSRVSFDINGCTPTQAPSVRSAGIGSQITGSRADIILLDDVEVPSNSATDQLREKLVQQCTEMESILMPKPSSKILYLGTPQTSYTIYRKLEERGYQARVWPARYPKDTSLYEGRLFPQLVADIEAGAKAGDPTDTRFSDAELLEREASMGRSAFALQFMLNTSLSDQDKFPLRFADLIVTAVGNECAERYAWSSDPRYVIKDLQPVGLPGDRFYGPMFIAEGIVPFSETIVAVDPSGRGADETVACVLSQANGYIFVRDMLAFKDGYSDETLTAIVRLGKKYQASTFLVESNFGDGMVCELIKRHMIQQQCSASVEEVRSTVRKEERIIATLEPVMQQHKLIVDPKVFQYDFASNPSLAPEKRLEHLLMYQISRMCKEKGAVKHDDRIDALAMGVQWFIDALAISAHRAAAERKHLEWDSMMQAFEDEPHLACDALVLGRSFTSIRVPKTKVYDWTSSR